MRLLDGFSFSCRPDCGLCCYARPRIEAGERSRLLAIAPQATFVGRGSDRFLAARPNGGACQFLRDQRCAVHAARPHPCREFPVSVHVGHRLQATVALGCPGLDLGPLTGPGADGPASGLEPELAAVRARLDASVRPRLLAAHRRGERIERALEEEGRWVPSEVVRGRLRDALPMPGAEDFPAEAPPPALEGWERLPLFFDVIGSPLGLSSDGGAWEVHRFGPEGVGEAIGSFVPPGGPPRLDAKATEALEAYLRYVLERDGFLAFAELAAAESGEGSVLDWTARELRALGAVVMARAAVRAQLRGGSGESISRPELLDGVRATDLDWLDRPTWGDRL